MLIDTGSTHSFVSPSFAKGFPSAPSQLIRELSISTPLGKSIDTDKVYKSCVVQVGQHELLADLVVLDFHDFDVILGMDWLSTHHGHVACFEKMVNFQPVGGKPFHFRGLRRRDIARLAALSLSNPRQVTPQPFRS